MDTLLTIFLVVLFFAGLLILAFWVLKKMPSGLKSQDLLSLQKEIHELHSTVQNQMVAVSQEMKQQIQQNTQFLHTTQQGYQQSIGEVQHRLGVLQEATQSMMDIGKDISSLQDILKVPKLRGGIGELLLSELLRQILPEENFILQHRFRSGSQVDAVIRLGSGLIPVDAKFPLENFKKILQAEDSDSEHTSRKSFFRDIRKHIESISSKYILPEEGTFDFALMYIPSENIYYEIIIKDDSETESLAACALRSKVIPVSPNSFYAYLQAIVRGLKGLKIERSAKVILERLGQLEVDLEQAMNDFEKVGSHLSHASSSYEKTLQRFHKLQNRLSVLDHQDVKLVHDEEKKISNQA